MYTFDYFSNPKKCCSMNFMPLEIFVKQIELWLFCQHLIHRRCSMSYLNFHHSFSYVLIWNSYFLLLFDFRLFTVLIGIFSPEKSADKVSILAKSNIYFLILLFHSISLLSWFSRVGKDPAFGLWNSKINTYFILFCSNCQLKIPFS